LLVVTDMLLQLSFVLEIFIFLYVGIDVLDWTLKSGGLLTIGKSCILSDTRPMKVKWSLTIKYQYKIKVYYFYGLKNIINFYLWKSW